MKSFTFGKRGIAMLSLVASLFVGGTNAAFAQYEESFENGTNGWNYKVGDESTGYKDVFEVGEGWAVYPADAAFVINTNYKNSGETGIGFKETNTKYYLITPKLAAGKISFYAKGAGLYMCPCVVDGDNYTISDAYGSWYFNETTSGDLSTGTMKLFSFDLPEDGYVAIRINKGGIDDFVAENGLAAEGAVAKPKNVAANDITFNSANLTWDAVEGATYQVVYSTEADFNADEVAANNAESNSYAMTGLNPETTYYVCVRAKVGEEVSAWTKAISFTTAVQFPAPTAFAVADYSETSATFQWTAGSTESAWQIAYSTDADFNADEATPVSVTENPYTLTGLTAETTYYVCLRANYGDGFSKWTEKVSVKPTAAKDALVVDGTAGNSYVPFYGYYADEVGTCGQYIIPASKMTDVAGRNITKLTIHASNANVNWGDAVFDVYMKEVDNETFEEAALADWDGMTKVYSGSLSVNDYKMEIELSTPFEYVGKNLMIGFNVAKGGSYASCNWYATSTSGMTQVYHYSSSTKGESYLPKTTITSVPGGGEVKPMLIVSEKNIDFGKVNAAAEKTFTVKSNVDTDVTITIDGDDVFTVEAPTTLKANVEATVTVKMNTETAGDYAAVVTVKAGELTENVNVAGTFRVAGEMFFEDFESYANGVVVDTDLPGWDKDTTPHLGADINNYEGQLMFYGGAIFYYATGASEEKPAYLTTPRLYVEGADDEMTIDVYRHASNSTGYIRVLYSADKSTWNTLATYGYQQSVTLPDYPGDKITFNGIPEGNWYVKFELMDAAIKEVAGFQLAPAAETLTLDQTVAPEALAEGMCDVTLNYTIAEGKWGTIALPFAVEDLSVLGDVKAYAFTGYENGNIKLDVTTTMEAGKPYVIYANAAISEAIELNNVNITATEAAAVEFNGAKFQATYAPLAAGSMEGKYGVAPTGKIQKGSAKASMKGFRGFFELPANAQNARLLINGEEVTGIEAIENAESADVVFDLQGRRVAQPTKGLYIIGGKKMMVK